jgi:8-oxo-dGTP diphosphatase
MTLHKHYVATAYIYDAESERFLLIHHQKLGKWLAPGGHLEPGEEPHLGALRELWEETGLTGHLLDLRAIPNVHTASVPQLPAPFCVLAEPIPATPKEDAHIHIDFVYVVEVDRTLALNLDEKEVARAQWFTAAEIETIETFDNIRSVCQAINALHQGKVEVS